MRKLITTIIFLLVIANVLASSGLGPSSIGVTLLSQEPDPVNPGEVVDVRLQIQNSGESPTDDLTAEFVDSYPLSVYDGNNKQFIGSLQSIQTGDDSVIVLFKVKVDEKAVQGTKKFDIKINDKSSSIVFKDFELRIRTRDLVLSIDDIKSEPAVIAPGENVNLTLSLTNNADSVIRDITVNLDLSGNEIPFAPSNSFSEKQIYQIQTKETKNLKFNLISLPNADGGIYKIPVTISYTDETGTKYEKDDILSLKVSSKPDILAIVDSSDIYEKKDSGEITIRLVNKGLSNIKLLTAELPSTDDFEVLTQKKLYVGNIDSDDYETIDYKIQLNKIKDKITLPLKVEYKDAINNPYEQTIDVDLVILSQKEAELVGLAKQKSIGGLIIFLVVVVGLGFYFYKKRKKNKR